MNFVPFFDVEPAINSGGIDLATIVCMFFRLFIFILEQHAAIRVVELLQDEVSYGLITENDWIGIAEKTVAKINSSCSGSQRR